MVEAAEWLTNVTKSLEQDGASPQDVSDVAEIMTTVVDVESSDPEVRFINNVTISILSCLYKYGSS